MRIKTTLSMVFVVLCFLQTSAQVLDMERISDMKPRSIGPGGPSGRVTSFAVSPINKTTIFTGTASGGLWKSESGGVSWRPVFDNQPTLSIGSVAIAPSNPSVVWAGTGEGNPRNSLNSGAGVFKSIDGGETWTCMGLEKTHNIHRVIVHPTNANIVYVGAIGSPWGEHSERGLYKTIDGGESWEQILFTNNLSGVADMVLDPSNPERLIVAMWQHDRDPWFFTSGGEGSGIYTTNDGGDHWKKLGSEDGLPSGELGRAGIAFCHDRPNVVYAYIESKKNALYRSDDGGLHWYRQGTGSDMGGRPFYYAEIYVDPQNENRVYSVNTFAKVSTDGGKTFPKEIAQSIHCDFHALWIDPTNPNYMLIGNDGGMGISYDRGENWRFVENLPVGQPYHVRVDMEKPYRVYGGMQDNGSFVGPAYKYSHYGLLTTEWTFLSGGDGFDAMPAKGDPSVCYTMFQKGAVQRFDLKNGSMQSIQPITQDETPLRFNWNSALEQDPFDENTIYFGSQFVHKSIDRGNSWQRISPDLTTNNSDKQQQYLSGGLTLDATGAENHCTILDIAPSTLNRNVLWVGTDDGQVQVTKDGGATWTNVSSRIKGMPEGAWVAQIKASAHHEEEAFVVVNNYRQNDFKPYLFHTTNFGKSWKLLVSEETIDNYTLSFVQDPVCENLLFLGTECGLYVSLDGAKNWTLWTNGFPRVPTMDLVIHPRENDLVMATYGRAFWVLDDIRPLRTMALEPEILEQNVITMIPTPEATICESEAPPGYAIYRGQYTGDGFYTGKNRKLGAMLSFYVPKLIEGKTATLQIKDENNELVRTIEVKNTKEGVNRVFWNFSTKGYAFPGNDLKEENRFKSGRSFPALPGNYTVEANYGESISTQPLKVSIDPTIEISKEGIEANKVSAQPFFETIGRYNKTLDQYKACKKTLSLLSQNIENSTIAVSDSLQSKKTAVEARFKRLDVILYGDKSKQGIYTDPENINSTLWPAMSILSSKIKATPNQIRAVEVANEALLGLTVKIGSVLENEWEEFITEYKSIGEEIIENL